MSQSPAHYKDSDRAVLRAVDLGKAYRDTPVFKHLDLKFGSGDIVALVGSNGAGKSTLLGCLAGVAPSPQRPGWSWNYRDSDAGTVYRRTD